MSCFCRLLLSAILLLLLLPGPVLAEGPQIAVDENEINFDPVTQGSKVEKVFTFKSVGDAILNIDRVKSSCGCTAALLSNRDLAPGESGEVRATFDSTRFQGLVVKTIYLYTNDPSHKVVQLHLRGEVKPEVRVTPRRLTLNSVVPGQEVAAKLSVANVGGKELIIENVAVTAKEIQSDFMHQVLQPGEVAEIDLRITIPEGKNGLNAYVLIELGGTVIAEQRIPVAVKVAQ
jgi:Protein of unknown function (DUF1573)